MGWRGRALSPLNGQGLAYALDTPLLAEQTVRESSELTLGSGFRVLDGNKYDVWFTGRVYPTTA